MTLLNINDILDGSYDGLEVDLDISGNVRPEQGSISQYYVVPKENNNVRLVADRRFGLLHGKIYEIAKSEGRRLKIKATVRTEYSWPEVYHFLEVKGLELGALETRTIESESTAA